MKLSADQLRQIYQQVKRAPRYSEQLQRRDDWHERLQRWVNPDLGGLNDGQLRSEFLEFFNEGGGVQTLNKIWRDRIIRDIGKFRRTIQHLLDETVPVEKRLDAVLQGPYQIDGLGKAVATHLLMASAREKYCLWNNKTEAGLQVLGLLPKFDRGSGDGERYLKIREAVGNLRSAVGARDFQEIDEFLHFVGAPEPEGWRALQAVGLVVPSDAVPSPAAPTTAVEVPGRAPAEIGEAAGGYVVPVETERQLEDFIEQNLETRSKEWFGRELELYQADEGSGRQFQTAIGRIDLLARDKEDNWVVIELKKGRSADAVVGQILRYMGWVKANLAREREEVRGIIIVGEGDKALSYAVTMTLGVELYTYHLQFHINRETGV